MASTVVGLIVASLNLVRTLIKEIFAPLLRERSKKRPPDLTSAPPYATPALTPSGDAEGYGERFDAEGYPEFLNVGQLASEPKTYVREQSPDALLATLAHIPPLSRNAVGSTLYAGKWVRWTGTIRHIDDRGNLYAFFVVSSDAGSFHVTFPLSARPAIDGFREGDVVQVDGQVRAVDDSVIEVVRAEMLSLRNRSRAG